MSVFVVSLKKGVAMQKLTQGAGEIVAKDEIYGRERSLLIEENARDRYGEDEKREKRKQHVGRDREGVDVHFGLHPVADGGSEYAKDTRHRGGRVDADRALLLNRK